MTTELLLQILIPAALSFAAGHFHLILPFKGNASAPALPTTFGHGELLSWFLSQITKQQASPAPVPATPTTPATPSSAEAILIEVIQILKQVLQAQVVVPAVPVAPKAA